MNQLKIMEVKTLHVLLYSVQIAVYTLQTTFQYSMASEWSLRSMFLKIPVSVAYCYIWLIRVGDLRYRVYCDWLAII